MKTAAFLVVALTGLAVCSESRSFLNGHVEVQKRAVPAKTYVVDLDVPARRRWDDVVKNFDPNLIKTALKTLMDKYLPSKALIPLLTMLGDDLERYIPQPFADEIRGISEVIDMPLGQLVLANLIYDISAFNSSGFKACTSIVAVDKHGQVIHGRNLDYKVPEFLRQLTVQVEYRKGGKPLFMSTTYAGYIGVITGAKHGAFTISGDQRNKGHLWQNLLSAAEDSWPTFFLERTVLEQAVDFHSALKQITETPTIAPIYYILGGIQPTEGAIVVRDRRRVLDVSYMGKDEKHPWYIVETNYDPWNAPPASDDRRDAAIKAMNRIGSNKIDSRYLYQALSVPLVFNSDTTYTTVMSAANSSIYSTWIRYDAPPAHDDITVEIN